MCTNYTPTERERLLALKLGVIHLPVTQWPDEIFPGYLAPIVVAGAEGPGAAPVCEVARFGLVPRWCVAKWLNEKGITAFVLKYRLVPTGEDGVQEISDLSSSNPVEIGKSVAPVLPLSIKDGLAAVSYVRSHSKEFNVDPDKIGFMGFSAGGAVTMGVAFNYTEANRPDFIVPVYPRMSVVGPDEVPPDAPPMLIICATDDPLDLAPASISLYSAWAEAGKSSGIHMYSTGGHGFGMKEQVTLRSLDSAFL
jgi:dienelactone hydrolase